MGGVVLLFVALLGTLTITRLDGVRVAGTAIAPPGLGAPSVGDCAWRLTVSVAAEPPATTGGPAPQVGQVAESDATFGGCTGQHVGEVVAYRTLPRQALTSVQRAADIEWCRSVASDYQAHVRWRVRDAGSGLWSPTTGQQFTVVLSDVYPIPDEPRWAACVVGAPANEAYADSYLRSFAVGAAPAPFGRCLTDGDGAREVSCTAPHEVQEFGVGSGAPMMARAAVAACRDLIAAMTGMADVTAAGRLRTEVIGGGRLSADPAHCRTSVVGPGRLTATLIGIGNAPLPLG